MYPLAGFHMLFLRSSDPMHDRSITRVYSIYTQGRRQRGNSPPYFRLVAAASLQPRASVRATHQPYMATAEHTSSSSLPVRQHRPAGWGTVMAAMLLALLAAFGRSPPVAMAAADSSPELIELTLLTGAKEKGAGLYILSSIASLFFYFFHLLMVYLHIFMRCIYAVCLDGSPPGYHFQRGFGSGSHSWIVFLQVTETD